MRKKDIKWYKDLIKERFRGIYDLVKNEKVGYYVEGEGIELICLGYDPILTIVKGEVIPTLLAVKKAGINSIPYAVVDEGAIKYLLNGADVMIPGITKVSEFSKGDIVAVWEPTESSPIVIGKALLNSDEVRERCKGKAIKNLHYAGDKIWKLIIKYLRES